MAPEVGEVPDDAAAVLGGGDALVVAGGLDPKVGDGPLRRLRRNYMVSIRMTAHQHVCVFRARPAWQPAWHLAGCRRESGTLNQLMLKPR